MNPGEKDCQWILTKAENHVIWDWNLANHAAAISFYRELVRDNPDITLPRLYLIDNLIADHRADEAEEVLAQLRKLPDANPVMLEVYRAHIALARFDEPNADAVIEEMLGKFTGNSDALFEAAQYYARKCDYRKAIDLYEEAFEKDTRRPRFTDALMGIAVIYEIMGDYARAAEANDRIISLLRDEWDMTEGTSVETAQNERNRLLAKVQA